MAEMLRRGVRQQTINQQRRKLRAKDHPVKQLSKITSARLTVDTAFYKNQIENISYIIMIMNYKPLLELMKHLE